MKYPEFLQENGTIGFVAPSFGCAIEPYRTAFESAQNQFTEKGYHIWKGPNCYADKGIGISNTPELCGKELSEAYCDQKSDILISCGGGELMCEVVPYIDFEKIRKAEPKWYTGYSDNTNFTFLLTTLCDTAAVYGPCAAAFGMKPWHESIQDTFDLLCGKRDSVHNYRKWEKESLKDETHPLLPYNVTEPMHIRYFKEPDVKMRGRLLGGCMDCLSVLVGTKYDRVREFAGEYVQDGIIWYLEACDLNIMSIRRTIWQMKHAGWFANVRGFLFGRPLCHGQEMFGLDQYRAVTDLLGEYHVPILMDLDIGHIAPMMPVVNGALAEITAIGDQLEMQYIFQ